MCLIIGTCTSACVPMTAPGRSCHNMFCVSSFRSAVSCAAPGQDPCPVDCGKRLLLRLVCCAGLLMGMTTEHPLSKSKVTWNRFADATNSGGNDQTIVVLCLGHGEAVGGIMTVFSFLEKRKCFDFVFPIRRFGNGGRGDFWVIAVPLAEYTFIQTTLSSNVPFRKK